VVAGRPAASVGVDTPEALLVREEHHSPADNQASVGSPSGTVGVPLADSR
jgi:hypothetical protein